MPAPDRGEVWLIRLDPTTGAEMAKTRPAVVLSPGSVGALPLRIVVPLTSWDDQYARYSWMVRVDAEPETGLRTVSAADAFQLRSVSLARLVRLLGRVSESVLDDVTCAAALCVGYPGGDAGNDVA